MVTPIQSDSKPASVVKSASLLTALPLEIFLLISPHLPLDSQILLSRTCRTFHQLLYPTCSATILRLKDSDYISLLLWLGDILVKRRLCRLCTVSPTQSIPAESLTRAAAKGAAGEAESARKANRWPWHRRHGSTAKVEGDNEERIDDTDFTRQRWLECGIRRWGSFSEDEEWSCHCRRDGEADAQDEKHGEQAPLVEGTERTAQRAYHMTDCFAPLERAERAEMINSFRRNTPAKLTSPVRMVARIRKYLNMLSGLCAEWDSTNGSDLVKESGLDEDSKSNVESGPDSGSAAVSGPLEPLEPSDRSYCRICYYRYGFRCFCHGDRFRYAHDYVQLYLKGLGTAEEKAATEEVEAEKESEEKERAEWKEWKGHIEKKDTGKRKLEYQISQPYRANFGQIRHNRSIYPIRPSTLSRRRSESCFSREHPPWYFDGIPNSYHDTIKPICTITLALSPSRIFSDAHGTNIFRNTLFIRIKNKFQAGEDKPISSATMPALAVCSHLVYLPEVVRAYEHFAAADAHYDSFNGNVRQMLEHGENVLQGSCSRCPTDYRLIRRSDQLMCIVWQDHGWQARKWKLSDDQRWRRESQRFTHGKGSYLETMRPMGSARSMFVALDMARKVGRNMENLFIEAESG